MIEIMNRDSIAFDKIGRAMPGRDHRIRCCRSAPRKGTVKHCNGSWRTNSMPTTTSSPQIDKLQPLVDAFVHRYNHHRPP